MNSKSRIADRLAAGMLWSGNLPVALLLVAGFLAVWSASYRSAEFGRGTYLDFYLKQIVWIAAGAGVFLFILSQDRRKVAKSSLWIYALCFAGVVAVIFFGRCINGSRRWIVLGPMNIQPSELMKIGVVMALARILSRRRIESLGDFLLPFAVVALPMAFILRQPDLGTSLLLFPVLFAMLYAAGAPVRKLLCVGVVLLAMVPVSYFFLLKDYQVRRVQAFLSQGEHTRSQKIGEAYQLIQSKVAVGSGKVWGKGWRQGTQNILNFTPFRHTDFIFAVIGEEWGFLGASGILALYLLIFTLSISVAYRAGSDYDRLLVTGLVTALGFQVLVNTAMAVGLAPITGLTLPLVSYGGSSMVTSFAALALIAGARNAGQEPGFRLAAAH
jgi:rod shape determining protein RodA